MLVIYGLRVNFVNKKIAISQSNYIPWKGYFDMIAYVDEFVLYDDMQYTKRDWRNRNKIITPTGAQWLTIPVKVKGKYYQKIKDTEIDGESWIKKHWGSIVQNYKKAPYFNELKTILEPLYFEDKYTTLSQCNRRFLEAICSYLEVNTNISNSWDYELVEGKSRKLLNICLQVGATEYVTGPAAKDYLDVQMFKEAGVKVTWFDYSDYPEYSQAGEHFIHSVSVLDLLFNEGKNSGQYMKYINHNGDVL